MRRFKITIAACILMAIAVPFTKWLAVSPDSPTYTHFVYMAGHAGWLHWAVNAWTLLVLHNLFRWYRVLTAYALAVMISYMMLPVLPMVGASVITCFFIGFAFLHFWSTDKLAAGMTLGLLLMTCILPGFAGIQHMIIFWAGISFFLIEEYVRNILYFLKR